VRPDQKRKELVTEHLNLVRSIAARIQRAVSYVVEMDELVSLGTLGLIQAANRFDPGAGVAFSTFAYYRVQGAIFDALRDVLPLPRPHSHEGDCVALLVAEEQSIAPDEELARAQECALVWRALRSLPPRHRRLIVSHYYEDDTLQDAGERIGVSKSWASRMHGRTLARLRTYLRQDREV
jgi:RNA polymerase sigma factor for flagellar operon FliA